MQRLYDIFISLMIIGWRVFSLFNEKAKKSIQGRKNSLAIVQKKIKGEDVIWMHAASLGEYEQGLPVLEKLKECYPQYKILVSFFSASGYENIINKPHIADAICYLPFDKKKEVSAFITSFKTKIFFTVKYDFWYHLLSSLKKQGAKIYVVSALFYEKQFFFKPYGKWFANQLKKNVDWFFHQTQHSEDLAKTIGLEQSSVSGDTRFDRVKQLRNRNHFVPLIEEFKENEKLIAFGSSWEAEEKIAEQILAQSPKTKIIIAPHDLKRIKQIRQQFVNAALYSQISKENIPQNILIIDSIGLLSKIYSYADIAVVGGGFHSAGLHNILEAATFGTPVIIGNLYKKNPEADKLIAHHGGKSFAKEEQATHFILNLLNNSTLLRQMSENAEKFVTIQAHSTEIILSKIKNTCLSKK